MTRLLKTTACLLVSSFLLLLPAAQAHGHGLNANKNNNNNAAAAGSDDKHGQQRSFRVREVRFSPFFVHNSTELNRALAILEHESQNCGNFGRRRNRKHGHNDNDDDNASAAGGRKQGGAFRSSGNKNNAGATGAKHGHKEQAEEAEERCFGRIKLVKAKTYKLEREYIIGDGFKLDMEGRSGVKIRAHPGQRHLTFDDGAVLYAHQVAFVDGGCDKEGFVGGSLLLINRASLYARGVNWTNNHAWSGGAIYADDARRVNVFHGVFKDNTADRKGGAVAIREERRRNNNKKHGHKGDDNNVAASNYANKKNEAAEQRRREAEERRKNKQAARAQAANKNKNKNKAVRASNNDDDNDGGVLGHHQKKGRAQARRATRAKFIRVKFAHNSANKGGALWNDGSHTEVEDCFFSENKAHVGGAIFNAQNGRMLVRETAFVRNKATAKGGAIFNDGWLWVVCSAFVDNQAPLGCDIFNNGWLKCTSETLPVKIDGHGHGYCTPCTPPQTAAPTVRSTPMRRVKKAEVVRQKKDKHEQKAGLFGGLGFGGHKNKEQAEEEEEADVRVFYDYYRAGEGSAYDRWNGYNSALVEEEEDEDFYSGYGYGGGYGNYGAYGYSDKSGASSYSSYADAAGGDSEGYYEGNESGEGNYGWQGGESYYGEEEGQGQGESYYGEEEGGNDYAYGDSDSYQY